MRTDTINTNSNLLADVNITYLVTFTMFILQTVCSASPAKEMNTSYPNGNAFSLVQGDTLGLRVKEMDEEFLLGDWSAVLTYDVGAWPDEYWKRMLDHNRGGIKIDSSTLTYGDERLNVLARDWFKIDTREYLRLSKQLRPSQLELSGDSLILLNLMTSLKQKEHGTIDTVVFNFLIVNDSSFIYETTLFRKTSNISANRMAIEGSGSVSLLFPLKRAATHIHISASSDSCPISVEILGGIGGTVLDTLLDHGIQYSLDINLVEQESYIHELRIRITDTEDCYQRWKVAACIDCGFAPMKYIHQSHW